jgi:hypothetical protein
VARPFVAPSLPLAAAVSDPPVRLAYPENLCLPHFVPCIQIRGTELDSASPMAEEPLAGRPWTMRTDLRSRPPKWQHDEPSGIARPLDPYKSRRQRLSYIRRTTSPMASGTQEKLTARRSNQLGSQDWSRCQKGQIFAVREATLSEAATNHTLKKWQPSGRASHLRNWTVKRRKKRGRKAAYLE